MPIETIQDFIRPKRTQSMPILQQGDLVSTADWIDANRCPRRATVNLVAKRTSRPFALPLSCRTPSLLSFQTHALLSFQTHALLSYRTQSPFVIPTEGRNLLSLP